MTIGLITLVATLVVSLLVTRIGSVALSLTGVATDVARFQARSAYTGVGFTTSESEQITNHPVRRRIVGVLMLMGNVGIAVVIASMMAAFAEGSSATADNDQQWWIRVTILFASLLAVWVIGTQKWVDQTIEAGIAWALKKWTTLDTRDYVSLLHLANGYVVFEIKVNEGDWVANKPLGETHLTSEGVLVLGIHQAGGIYVGSPNGKTLIQVGDMLSVYGPRNRLEELDLRKQGKEGDQAHQIAMEQKKVADESESL